jgi:hypothetical protein
MKLGCIRLDIDDRPALPVSVIAAASCDDVRDQAVPTKHKVKKLPQAAME